MFGSKLKDFFEDKISAERLHIDSTQCSKLSFYKTLYKE